MWNAIKSFFKRVYDNIVAAMRRLVDENYEIGTEFGISDSTAEFLASRFTAVVVVAAGLFFVLYPFQGKATMAIGDNLLRSASYMWNGAT